MHSISHSRMNVVQQHVEVDFPSKYDYVLHTFCVCGHERPHHQIDQMMQRRVLLAASAALRRRAPTSPALRAATNGIASRWSSSSSSEPPKRTVQVLHNKPQTSYVHVEQDIAAMQREIRDAYKCVPLHTNYLDQELSMQR